MIEQIKPQLNQQSTLSPQTEGDLNYSSMEEQSVSSLADADYEFLFNQLLEGVAHGWHPVKIAKFFQRLGERGEQKLWVNWLERYQAKIAASSDSYQQPLAARMMRLGEITQTIPSIKQIGRTAHSIGREILQKKNADLIWEYNGSDLLQVPQETTTEEVKESQAATEDDGETIKQNNSTSTSSNFADAANWIQEAIAEFVELAEQAADESEAENNAKVQTSTETEDNRESPEQPREELPADHTTTTETQEEKNPLLQESNLAKADNLKPSVSEKNEKESLINLSWQEFTQLIETDEGLAQQIAQQFDLTDKDPQSIISAITSQLDNQKSAAIDESTLELVESWFNLGLKQASAGDFNEAVVSWEKALELNPNLVEAWHNRGSALGRLGNYQQALKSFEQALKIAPQNAQAWNDLAHTFYQLQQWQEAIASWDKAISIVPSNHQFWYNRGCSLERLQQNNEAIASYEKALEIKPDFLLAKSRYASLLANQNPIN